ncbi:MAG: kelch repeat-containing protein [Leptolyngbyaceae cyanobacterium]
MVELTIITGVIPVRPNFSLLSIAGLLAVSMVPIYALETSFSASEELLYRWELVATENSPQRESGSVFVMKDQDTIGVFGGYSEALDISGFTQPTESTFFNDIILFHAPTQTWKTQPAKRGPLPSPRTMSCTVYHESTNALYVFGGVSFAADFSSFTYYGDHWKFDFDENTWTALTTMEPSPSARASSGCALVDDAIYLFSGGGENFSIDNELWRYDISSNAWTLLQANASEATNRPPARTQSNFAKVPGENKLLVQGGDAFDRIPDPPFLVAKTQEDVWVYDIETDTWESKAVHNKPALPHNHQAFAFISSRYFLVQNGDAQGAKTVADTCQFPLQCLIPAMPTNDTFVYDLVEERWSFLPLASASLPPTRRSMMGRLGDTIYLFGGYGWDGANGYSSEGKIGNENTWKLQIAPQYLEDFFYP